MSSYRRFPGGGGFGEGYGYGGGMPPWLGCTCCDDGYIIYLDDLIPVCCCPSPYSLSSYYPPPMALGLPPMIGSSSSMIRGGSPVGGWPPDKPPREDYGSWLSGARPGGRLKAPPSDALDRKDVYFADMYGYLYDEKHGVGAWIKKKRADLADPNFPEEGKKNLSNYVEYLEKNTKRRTERTTGTKTGAKTETATEGQSRSATGASSTRASSTRASSSRHGTSGTESRSRTDAAVTECRSQTDAYRSRTQGARGFF
ncbi:hypothetical protein IQ07DRAFT_598711 [Pyrenochaeta sp. DS3sAY3a]|nr:hypothetical protein IQ07DRAFT_598711 [Pyrenochaeta sp. DS3sAY3a]